MTKKRPSFLKLNEKLTRRVVADLESAERHSAVLAEAPPGAGKSTLIVSVAWRLIAAHKRIQLAIVTQTNEQADDIVASLARSGKPKKVGRLTGSNGPSPAMVNLAKRVGVRVGKHSDEDDVAKAKIVVSTARKWQYERSRLQNGGGAGGYPFALIDEAYQMRSDMLLAVADLFETLFCVGDPGQLDPFTTVDDGLWKGLPYAPSRAALATLRAYHPGIEPIQLPVSWRLPPSAASIVSDAFYPFASFDPGTGAPLCQGSCRLS